jgi:hypothetical protein
MKGDIVEIKGEKAKIIGEVGVFVEGRARPILVQLFELIPSGILVVSRNGFAQGTFGNKARAVEMFLQIIEDEAL